MNSRACHEQLSPWRWGCWQSLADHGLHSAVNLQNGRGRVVCTLCNVDCYIPIHAKHNSIVADAAVCLSYPCWKKTDTTCLSANVALWVNISPKLFIGGNYTYKYCDILVFPRNIHTFAMRQLKIMFNQTKGLLQFLPPLKWWVSLQY